MLAAALRSRTRAASAVAARTPLLQGTLAAGGLHSMLAAWAAQQGRRLARRSSSPAWMGGSGREGGRQAAAGGSGGKHTAAVRPLATSHSGGALTIVLLRGVQASSGAWRGWVWFCAVRRAGREAAGDRQPSWKCPHVPAVSLMSAIATGRVGQPPPPAVGSGRECPGRIPHSPARSCGTCMLCFLLPFFQPSTCGQAGDARGSSLALFRHPHFPSRPYTEPFTAADPGMVYTGQSTGWRARHSMTNAMRGPSARCMRASAFMASKACGPSHLLPWLLS